MAKPQHRKLVRLKHFQVAHSHICIDVGKSKASSELRLQLTFARLRLQYESQQKVRKVHVVLLSMLTCVA